MIGGRLRNRQKCETVFAEKVGPGMCGLPVGLIYGLHGRWTPPIGVGLWPPFSTHKVSWCHACLCGKGQGRAMGLWGHLPSTGKPCEWTCNEKSLVVVCVWWHRKYLCKEWTKSSTSANSFPLASFKGVGQKMLSICKSIITLAV